MCDWFCNLILCRSGDDFQREALKAHNEYRASHGVPPLKLDKDLCKFSQEWAENLSSRGVMQHRPNNKYGENIYCKYGTGNVTVDGKEPVKSWYDEIQQYNFSSPGFSTGTGHFTQVIWRESTKLGIAKVENSKGQVFVVANYDPPGNVQGQYEENVPKIGAAKKVVVKEQPKTANLTQAKTSDVKGFSQFEVETLNSHNKYRKMHHAPPLSLNRNLCKFAEEWAKNLASRGVMQHRSNNSYGENIYYKWGTGNISVKGDDAVDSWYSEIKDYTFAAGKFTSGTGHFTQVVWKESRELGVGMAKNSKNQIFVVCNYDPAGNYEGQFRENVLPK
ncbi:venom allergen 5-like [Culicoides brevitarsis]|uniref:venom allergen 5-like n=1 Tax=Culicoides brevitarsis TaxID=469753 RepID=UPI00307B3EC6